MNAERGLRDPHLRAFTEEVAEEMEAAVAHMTLPLPSVPVSALGELLGWVVPKPVLRAALETTET